MITSRPSRHWRSARDRVGKWFFHFFNLDQMTAKSRRSAEKLYEIQAGICRCLANSNRLMILDILGNREMSVTVLAGKMGISKANLSQHLAIMKDKGILNSRREGLRIFYSLANPKVRKACGIMKEVLYQRIKEDESLRKKNRR
jgi:ArsR family transcriptional regulator